MAGIADFNSFGNRYGFDTQFKKEITDEVFENIYGLTGIPSMEEQYKKLISCNNRQTYGRNE